METTYFNNGHVTRDLPKTGPVVEKTPNPFFNSDAVNYLDKILRGEISAVECYEKVISKFPYEAVRFNLRHLKDNHHRAISELRSLVRAEGEVPSETSGVWGMSVGLLMDTASFIGDKSAIGLLVEGEEHGLSQYEEALKMDLSVDVRNCIKYVLIPQIKLDIEELKRAQNSLK